MALTRKAFLVQLVGGGWVLSGCGGGGDGGGGGATPPGASGGICGVSISGNHGHVLSVPLTDLTSTTDKTYDIQGGAAHTHSVTFTVAQLQQLRAGQVVSVVSTMTLGHEHTISENCA